MRKYITTAIDYPNAAPHMGHVLEKVLADVVARWWRLSGHDVRFQIGTDEHGIKIQRTADAEGLTPRELLDRNVPLFKELYATLGISHDDFIETSDQERHWPTVRALWEKLEAAEVLEKRSYTGLYCSGCERYMTEKELEDGVCPTHKKAPDSVTEENYFFTLSEDSAWLKDLLTKSLEDGGYEITPGFRSAETLSLLDQGLEDVSFSRPTSSLAWGVPVPSDSEQTMYVWCDALTNYISTLNFLTDSADKTYWDDAEVTHVIGKDIARFHALIWPAMLRHAEIATPNRLLIHGFLTSEGEKMSKSLGNVVVPQEVIEKYGTDPLRFYLSHEVPVGRDGDFSWDRFGELYDALLRNKLGNLLNRVLVMLRKTGGELSVLEVPEGCTKSDDGWAAYEEKMNAFDIHGAMQYVMQFVDAVNAAMDKEKPWEKDDEEKLQILTRCSESLRHIALLLLPVMPEAAQKMSYQLGVPYAEQMLEKDFVISEQMKKWAGMEDWKMVGEPEILFEPVE